MTKVLKQLTVTDRFVSTSYLSSTKSLLTNNEGYEDYVCHFDTVQEKAKAYYVQARMPYNTTIPTAYIFKIRDTNTGVADATVLDFENDTHQVVKYSEAPYTNVNKNADNSKVSLATVSYLTDGVTRYHAYTYNQLLNETELSFSEDDFNNIQSSTSPVRTIIKNYILENFDVNATTFKFDLQKIDTSSLSGSNNYIVFDFIFISKIPWNEFICCYDRNSYDQYITGGRTLDPTNSSNIYVRIYPFVDGSDLIERTEEEYGANRIYHSSLGEIDKLTLKVYNGTNAVYNVPFYLNSQSLKIGPSKQYSLDSIPIYNFGIPNINGYTCVIEYEYDNE